MIDQLRALAVFAKTVERGSFRGAARELRLSPSVVSHHVAQLEASLDVALLYRTTRRLALTREGERLYAKAREMVAAASSGIEEITLGARSPTGQLTVAGSLGMLHEPLFDDLAAFARAHPRVSLTLRFADVLLDLVRDGIDVALRAGTLRDSSLKSRRLAPLRRTLVGAPEYVARRPRPDRPHDLAAWDWILLGSRSPSMRFVAGARTATVEVASRLVADSAHVLVRLASLGLGIAIVPSGLVARDLAEGSLVEVLPEWRPESPTVHAVWPANAPRQGLARRLVDFLAERAGDAVKDGA